MLARIVDDRDDALGLARRGHLEHVQEDQALGAVRQAGGGFAALVAFAQLQVRDGRVAHALEDSRAPRRAQGSRVRLC
jgi:hypothetical protein